MKVGWTPKGTNGKAKWLRKRVSGKRRLKLWYV